MEKEVAAVLGVLRMLLQTPELLRDVGAQEVTAMAHWTWESVCG